VSNSVASAAHSSVSSGRLLVLAARCRRAELHHVADRGAAEVLVELGGDQPGADQVLVVVGGEPLDRLVVTGPVDVDLDVVALTGRAFHRHELAVLGPDPVHLGIDLVVGHDRGRHLDPQPVVTGDHDGRSDLDGRGERQVTGLLAGGDRQLGWSDHVDVVGDGRLGVELGQGLAERLGPGVVGPELRLEQLPWGPTGAEARELHLGGDLPPGLVHHRGQFVLGHGDLEDDEVARLLVEAFGFGVHGRMHRRGSLPMPRVATAIGATP
jgi:hypothetical protein